MRRYAVLYSLSTVGPDLLRLARSLVLISLLTLCSLCAFLVLTHTLVLLNLLLR